VLDAFADPFDDFACAFTRSHRYVLTGGYTAFADVPCRVDGMQRGQICRSLANTLGGVAGTFPRPGCDIAGSACDVSARTSLFVSFFDLCLALRTLVLRCVLTLNRSNRDEADQD
jgi:hypothetical protein